MALVLSGGGARGAYETHWARASLASNEAGTPRSGRSSRRAARAAGGFRSRGPCGPSSPPTGSEKRARRGASSSGARPPSPFTRPRSPSERGRVVVAGGARLRHARDDRVAGRRAGRRRGRGRRAPDRRLSRLCRCARAVRAEAGASAAARGCRQLALRANTEPTMSLPPPSASSTVAAPAGIGRTDRNSRRGPIARWAQSRWLPFDRPQSASRARSAAPISSRRVGLMCS